MRAAAGLRNSRKVGFGAGMILCLVLACFTLNSLWLVTAASETSSKDPPPNFVVFFVDDLGYGDLGFTGKRERKEKNSDWVFFQLHLAPIVTMLI